MEDTLPPRASRGRKILIVDDDVTSRTALGAVLQHFGFEYLLASDGAEGVNIFRDRRAEICLVIADVSMPVKSGIQMFREILEIDPRANVILTSGYCLETIIPEDLQKLCKALEKPFTASHLISTVSNCLRCEQEPENRGIDEAGFIDHEAFGQLSR